MKRSYDLTRHHIIPRSRGGKNLETNICYVPDREHNVYHQLFENKTPNEIIHYLNTNLWNNYYEITDRPYDPERIILDRNPKSYYRK